MKLWSILIHGESNYMHRGCSTSREIVQTGNQKRTAQNYSYDSIAKTDKLY